MEGLRKRFERYIFTESTYSYSVYTCICFNDPSTLVMGISIGARCVKLSDNQHFTASGCTIRQVSRYTNNSHQLLINVNIVWSSISLSLVLSGSQGWVEGRVVGVKHYLLFASLSGFRFSIVVASYTLCFESRMH